MLKSPKEEVPNFLIFTKRRRRWNAAEHAASRETVSCAQTIAQAIENSLKILSWQNVLNLYLELHKLPHLEMKKPQRLIYLQRVNGITVLPVLLWATNCFTFVVV